ncbi:GNAT family N-acetyltransferase [Streptomyces sp. NPDC006739]|uniref:GNAT family N-acetyltransferase n=1 Tax=Streptomyces sp. NPDC006739 TaxID=3364763 RepID=UPI003679E77C
MSPAAHWQLTEDLDGFLSRAGDFLRSAPALHTIPLTVTDTLRRRGPRAYGDRAPLFGWLEGGVEGEADDRAGTVRAALIHTPPHPPHVTALAAEDADALAARLLAAGHEVPGVFGERAAAAAFAEAWQRRTGVPGLLREHERLYRLGELTAPEPVPEGRARVAGAPDRELLMSWHGEFAEAVGRTGVQDAGAWADARIDYGGITLWETPAGTPVAMAGLTAPPRAGHGVRVGPVYTPAHLRGRGYAGAVTVAVSRAALRAGAAEVLLFTDLANPTSNGLYQRIGYRPVADFDMYGFGTDTADGTS